MEAQTTTGSMLGNVRDKSGSAIPQAYVTRGTLRPRSPGASLSDETGVFLITSLLVGEYMILTQKQGFSKYVRKGIQMAVDQNARLDVALVALRSAPPAPA